jgi:regulator of protease activity HflC (stomatin/prohibitin superfamily)
VVPNEAAEFVDEVGLDNVGAIIDEAVFDAIKEQSGLVQAEALAQNLGELGADIFEQVVPALAPYHVAVTQVGVKDAIFDPDFIQSVKDKVIATQEAEEQENLVAAREAEKDQVVIQAQAEEQKKLIEARGEQAAITSVAAALQFSPAEYLEWLRLQRWDGVLPDTLVGDSGDLSLLLTPSIIDEGGAQ